MAADKRRQLSVKPNYTPTRPAGVPNRAGRLGTGIALAVGAAALIFGFTGPGVAFATGTFRFLAFYAGVFSLVALSITVMVGLAATDRLVLMVRHRVVMQSIHRAVASAAMLFLVVHILTKIAQRHASIVDVVVPFVATHRTIYVGLGTVASYLMVAITITGVMRARFAGTSHAWLWRAMHATAYLCWPIALLHGLNAGRPAKAWVTTSYDLCLILVGLALMVRLWVVWTKQLSSPRTRTAGIAHAAPIPRPRATTATRRTSPAAPRTTSAHLADLTPVAVALDHEGPIRPGLKVSSSYRSPSSERDPQPSAAPVAPPKAPATETAARPKPVGRWVNANTDTITDEEFWSYLRNELLE